ncbi:DNA polymerase III subunit beta [Francisella adeliensis]|uniref:Beta sliding clamp n=1 Tax=Francisella adeliensis TaxID=2007306 RepID=A0A2Z4XW27_9GAMM|nr:DNA polymerase III subunit beta [Francisella adeliensis]AXA32899.1 DNA polymerase III subunit beta [Francisella adeliensis]MBK2086398.1 DNA polymerase III subunit beta [Francisella adeliensis]MBK2096613.1 DNA polymerase III subunit beta [Francisella adeliensis]QIW11125.1 DNA polymerase III subunit beta [Francisella adeliensis]QIW13002.1 DNA polymerase III subunit beta [Francisella adeliensis]
MNFVLNRDDLLKPLQSMLSIANSKSTMPLLSCILFDIQDNKLKITASDLDTEITCSIAINCDANMKLALNADKIYNIVRSLNDNSMIDFNINDNKVTISSNNSKFNLMSLNADNFPLADGNIQEESGFDLSQQDFHHIISKIDFSMANDDTRYFLNGMFWEVNGNLLRAVSTDGHRMSITEAIINSKVIDTTCQSIIPKKAITELKKIVAKTEDTIKICLGKTYLKAEFGEFIFISKLIDGRYPDYQKVIPKNNTKLLAVDKKVLKDSLLRTSILANDKYKGVRLNISPGQILLSANNPENEKAEESVEVQYNEDSMEICFNYRYLLDIISVLNEDTMSIYLDNPNMSALVKDEKDNSLFIIMPMKI